MRFTPSRAKARPKKTTKPRRKSGVRKGVSAKATSWLHARARDVRHRPRTVALGIMSGLLSTIILGLWLSGHLGDTVQASGRFMDNRLLAMGFGVEHVDVAGANRVSQKDVLRALAVEKGEPIFRVDLQAARDRVKSLGWVREAYVARLLPNRISVVVTEATPYARWQHGGEMELIGATGSGITSIGTTQYASLPLVVGKGANTSAAAMVSTVQGLKPFAGNVAAYVRVSDRRWDIQFKQGSEIKLPADNAAQVLRAIAVRPAFLQMLQLPDTVLDARVPGEVAVRRKGEVSGKKVSLLS